MQTSQADGSYIILQSSFLNLIGLYLHTLHLTDRPLKFQKDIMLH